MAYRLDPLRPLREEAVRAFRERLRKAVAAIAPKRAAPPAERIHTARTTAKKLRALLALAGAPRQPGVRKMERRIARAGRRLASWRDADATRTTVDELARLHASDVPPGVWTVLRDTLSASASHSAEQNRKVEAGLRRFARDLERVDRRFTDETFSDRLKPVAQNFGAAYRKARRAFRHVKAAPGADAFHGWRKATKTVAYECRLLRGAWPEVMKPLRQQFDEASILLGAEHDLTVLRAQTRRWWAEKKLPLEKAEVTAVLRVITRRRQELRAELLPRGERLFVDRPGAVRRRIVAWWRIAAAYPLPAAT